MRIVWITAAVLAGVFAARGQETAVPADSAPAAEKRVVLCPVTGEIGDGTLVVVKRAVEEARAQGAAALVMMVDTPGGMLDAAIEITEVLRNAPCKTVAYVHGMGAISAGALITYACDDIVMTKGTGIGASTPISMQGELPAEIGEKTKSYLRSKYRSLGEEKGHDPYLGEAMVDAKVELHGYRDANGKYVVVRVRGEEHKAIDVPDSAGAPGMKPVPELGETHDTKSLNEDAVVRELVEKAVEAAKEVVPGLLPGTTRATEGDATYADQEHPFAPLPNGAELIDPAGELLTLTTAEAEHVGLSKATVLGLDDALALYDLQLAKREFIEPTTAERFYAWLVSPMISGLLLMIGLAGIYWEIKTPGFGLPGVTGIVCLSLFFGSHMVLGLAEWLDVLLVVAGVGLILAEVFLFPGTTAAGIAGFLCIVAGIYLALTRVTIPEYSFEFVRLGSAVTTASVSLVSLLVFIVATWKLLPKTPLPRLMVQGATQPQEAGYTVQTAADAAEYLGAEGEALTMLRPAGRARVHGKVIDVVTQGEFVAEGKSVVVVRVDGNRHVVREKHNG